MNIKKFYHYGETKEIAIKKAGIFLDSIMNEIDYSQIIYIAVVDRNEPEELFKKYKFRVVTKLDMDK